MRRTRTFKQYIIEEHGYQPPKPRTPEGEHRFDKMVQEMREHSRPTTTLSQLRASVSDTTDAVSG